MLIKIILNFTLQIKIWIIHFESKQLYLTKSLIYLFNNSLFSIIND